MQPTAILTDVHRSYGRIAVLEGLDLEIHQGEVLALLGPNGSGKTTTVRLLLGLISPHRGHVRILGGDPRDRLTRLACGALLQIGKVPESLTVREHIESFRSYYPDPMPFNAVVSAAGLEGLEGRLYGRLSGGQQQRVLLALALAGDPELLILDEPTTGLDVEARRRMWEAVERSREARRSVLLTTHNLAEAEEVADRVVMLRDGRALDLGSPAQIRSRSAVKILRFRSSIEPERVSAVDPVASVATEPDGRWRVETHTPEAILRELFAAGFEVADLEIAAPTLEHLYLELCSTEGRNL